MDPENPRDPAYDDWVLPPSSPTPSSGPRRRRPLGVALGLAAAGALAGAVAVSAIGGRLHEREGADDVARTGVPGISQSGNLPGSGLPGEQLDDDHGAVADR